MQTHKRYAALVLASVGVMLLVAGQARGSQRASVAGVVVDATTARPLEGATVALMPFPEGLFPTADEGLSPAQVQVTGADGRYHFAHVPAGRYRLRIERIGFRAATLETEVRQPVDTRISVSLELTPLALRPIQVQDHAVPPFRRIAGGPGEPEGARASLERQRQDLFLTPDSRILTLADVQDGVTLGENDVFRALQRFPGIATRDDYTAELWTRGAPWSQTRVTFDDVPLFNPVHAVGVFSGVSTDALGAVFLHSGVRSAMLAGGAAGAVELRSRGATGQGELRGAADASLATAKLTLEQRPGGGRSSWLVSARRSYLDLFTGGFGWLGFDQLDLPYAFHDVTARVDLPLGNAAVEASALWEEDRLYGDVDEVVERTTAAWGNIATRVTLHVPVAGLATRHAIGVSRYSASIREAGDSAIDERGLWIEPETDNSLVHIRLAGDFAPASSPSWSAGYEMVTQHAVYDGPEPRYYPVRPDTTLRIMRDDRSVQIAAWADRRWQAGALAVQPGLRIETGSRALSTAAVRVAPRLQARLMLGSGTILSAAAGRTWQDLQSLSVAGPSAHPAFHAGQFWLQAGAQVPALRADLVTAGLEQWLGDHWLAGLSAYARDARGVVMPDPRPGSLLRRPRFATGSGSAHGAEASVRRIAGAWTASAAYSWGEASIEADGYTYPAPADRTHRVDATMAVRLPAGLRIGAAWTAMSGAPYTRTYARAKSPDCELFGFSCGQELNAWIDAPNAERTPDYRSLDGMVTWSHGLGRFHLTTYLQIRNILDRDNASTYSGTVPRVVRGRGGNAMVEWIDRFEAGLPRMPLVGARVAF